MLHFFARRLADAQKEQKGFTLIELLVVIIIIGILAAIAIPTFLAQRKQAWNAAAESELRNAAAAATSCSVSNGGAYNAPNNCGDATVLDNYGWNNDSNVTEALTATATVWSATANHINNTACVYSFTTDETNALAGQVTPGAGCPG